ncbi:MAG: hypothetical protein HKL90_14765 [Elusimicrobia bacterium]|nr:hypothetical protein [Elusimicrobiota bacterium]
MPKPRMTRAAVGRALGAQRREGLTIPFYYAPGLFKKVREHLKERLASGGGRPGVADWRVVRKTRYSEKTWKALQRLAVDWSKGGTTISPAQIAARIVEEAVSRGHTAA